MTPGARIAVLAGSLVLPAAVSCATFAVVPLVGRHLMVVTADATTATRVDRNDYRYVGVPDDAFDKVVRAGVELAVRARRPADSTLAVTANWTPGPNGDVPEDLVARTIDAVAPRALEAGATHLVIVAPYRAPPALRVDRGVIGSGHVAGIGLYVNRFQRMRDVGTTDSEHGYLGLFANLRVAIVDARSRAIIAEETTATGFVYGAVHAADGDPMNALTTAQKIAGLQDLLQQALAATLPGLLAKAQP